MSAVTFLKTKFYPVNVEQRIILNTPKDREIDCSHPNGASFTGYIGLLGKRLNHPRCYESFTIKPE